MIDDNDMDITSKLVGLEQFTKEHLPIDQEDNDDKVCLPHVLPLWKF